MINFIKFSNQLTPLDNLATDDLMSKLKTKSYDKNAFILKTGEVCQHLYFVEKGLTKTFFNNEDKEFIMLFFSENSMFTVLDSFITQQPSTYNILALEHTELTYISKTDLEQLCKRHHCIETFFRKLLSFASIKMMKRISGMLEENATVHYNNFLIENKAILQRISLGDVANYLGVTQVTLSRIRSKH